MADQTQGKFCSVMVDNANIACGIMHQSELKFLNQRQKACSHETATLELTISKFQKFQQFQNLLSVYKSTAFKLSASCLAVKLAHQQVIHEIYTGQKLLTKIHCNQYYISLSTEISVLNSSFCGPHK